MEPGNELVLRGVLEAGKVFRRSGSIVTIGRDEASSIVLGDGSTSLAHAEIVIADGRATLRDVGSDTGTFYGKNEDRVRQLGHKERVMLGQGDRIGFGLCESELYRVEHAPDVTLCKVDGSSPPQLQASSTATVEHPEDKSEDGEGDNDSQREAEQLAAESVDEMERSRGERCVVIVTVVRAEGLPGVTTSNVFRRPKNKQTHRRYVRIRMTDNREGRGLESTAVTSSVAGSGSTCSWGEKGRIGENLYLQVAKDALDSLERPSSESVTQGTAAFEVEVWNEASEGGGEDVLLGRGQARPTFVDSQPRWVMLDSKGKVEISIATTLRRNSSGKQIDGDDQKSMLTQDEQASQLGNDPELQGDSIVTDETPGEVAPKLSSPKWGLPRMPDLKDTLNVSLARTPKLKGKQRAHTGGGETSKEHVATDSPAEEAGQHADAVEDGGEQQVAIVNVPSDEHVPQGKQAGRAALRGMQSIKEGLQARLLGTSGKFSAMRGHAQNEEVGSVAEPQEDDEARGVPPASSEEGTLSASGGVSSNVTMTRDEPGTSEALVQQDNIQTKRMSRDAQESEPLTEDGKRTDRGRSTHLRSLLQDTSAGDQGEHHSQEAEQDEEDRTDEAQTARRDTAGEQTPESQTKGPVAQVVSALDAISAKAAAASASKFKSTLSSSSMTSTLKGFGWNRHKEAPVKGGISSPSGSSFELVPDVPSATPAGVNEASESASTQRKGSLDPSTPPSEATTLEVTILRASGLPEVLAKSKFGWAKKNATQDPVVRLSMCDAFTSSSVVERGGCNCRWGTKNEGETLELSIPSSKVPAEGLGTLNLVVEVFNKGSDEAENDILLGSTQILVGEWLGKKAKWAAMDGKRSPGGRVKLSLALKGSENIGGERRSSDASHEIAADSGGDTPDDKVDEAGSTTPRPDATNALVAEVGDTAQQTEELTNQIEAEENVQEVIAQHDGEILETAHTERMSREGVPSLALGSAPDGNQQQATHAEDASSNVSVSAADKNTGKRRGGEENQNDSVRSTNDSSRSSDITEKEEVKEVGISILVVEADELPARAPEDEVGTPKSDPYVVLHVCGKKQATSAVIAGGAKCQWPGAGEEISFETSYDALTAVGWGREDAVGPLLTVEIYNQESQTREADVFIGSANVTLKEYLGFGPKWVVIHRRRKGRGRVLIDVKSPMLQQDISTPAQIGNMNTIGACVDEKHLQQSVALDELQKSSSSGQEGESREETGGNRTGDPLSKNGSDGAGKNDGTEPPRSTGSDGSSVGSLRKTRQTQEITSSAADIDSTSADTAGSHLPHELSRQQSQASAHLMPDGDQGEIEGDADKSTMAEGADTDSVQSNVSTPSKAMETPDAVASIEGTSHGLARGVAGGTSTALDLTAAMYSSERKASILEEQTEENCPVITVVGSRERLDTDTPRSSRHESNSPSQSRPFAHEKKVAGQPHPKERQGSSDLNEGGASTVGTKHTTSNGHPATSNEAPAEGLCAKLCERPRNRRIDPQRIIRAREIIRRRRTMVSNVGHASPALRGASGIRTSAPGKAHAATTIQGAFRGRITRRHLRVRQRAVVKIQAAYRGYVERKAFVALSARSKRAKVEEQRARARRSRIALTTQELNLLRSTPAQQLLRVDALRADASACRIQRLWRRISGVKVVSKLDRDGGKRKELAGSNENRNHTVTAPEILCRSTRVSVSGMSLEALRLRVANRQRVRERSRDGGRDTAFPRTASEPFSETGRKPKAVGTVDSTYRSLLQWQEKASHLSATFRHSETERHAAAKRRRERLANFKRTQEQLLHPPKLSRSRKANLSVSSDGHFETTAAEESRRRHILKIAADERWAQTQEPSQRDRAQRAHALAVAAANARGKKSWATCLPPDVGYDELVDIRTVVVPWPKTSVGREGRFDFVDGFVRRRSDSSEERCSRPSNLEFGSDEASLWWYAYARTEGAHATGLPQEDLVFAELLERVKATPGRRKEQAEREEQLHQLRVARKKQITIDKVVHRHRVANCPSLVHARRRVTAAQRCAAVTIQSHIRGFLERKRAAVLRAEMRVFGALQVLVNELRQPELEAGDNTNSLAVILAEHVNGQSRNGEHGTDCRSHLPRGPNRGPTKSVVAACCSD